MPRLIAGRFHSIYRCVFDGAGDEIRTRDIYLGKVVLYQLSYSRKRGIIYQQTQQEFAERHYLISTNKRRYPKGNTSLSK